MVENGHICDIGRYITGITFHELEVTKKEDGNKEAEDRSHVFWFETYRFHLPVTDP